VNTTAIAGLAVSVTALQAEMVTVQAQVGALVETDVTTINTTLTTHTSDITQLQTDMDNVQYNATNITYTNLTDVTTTISSDNVVLSIPAGSTTINSKLYVSSILPSDSLTNTISIGSSAQTDTIILNGHISTPLMDLYNVFTSTSNGYLSQI
jgi:hypothetical protein